MGMIKVFYFCFNDEGIFIFGFILGILGFMIIVFVLIDVMLYIGEIFLFCNFFMFNFLCLMLLVI